MKSFKSFVPPCPQPQPPVEPVVSADPSPSSRRQSSYSSSSSSGNSSDYSHNEERRSHHSLKRKHKHPTKGKGNHKKKDKKKLKESSAKRDSLNHHSLKQKNNHGRNYNFQTAQAAKPAPAYVLVGNFKPSLPPLSSLLSFLEAPPTLSLINWAISRTSFTTNLTMRMFPPFLDLKTAVLSLALLKLGLITGQREGSD